MRGHKRDQCFTQTTPRAETMDKSDDLARVLKNLHIQSGNEETRTPTKATPKKQTPAAPARTETLLSLSSDDKAELDGLSKAGMMKDESVDDDIGTIKADIQRWLETGPLSPSRLSNRFKQSSVSPRDSADSNPSLTTSRYGSVASTAKPLGRTSSLEEREVFLNILAEKSKKPVASVFTISMCDIHELEENAKKHRFHARVIAPKYADGTTGDGWLVIGREANSVDHLFDEVARDVKGGMRSTVGTLGSGAVGAAAAWLYLAFS